MALSRKHFTAMAEIIKNLPENSTKGDIALEFAYYFRGEDSNFNHGKFMDACKSEQIELSEILKD